MATPSTARPLLSVVIPAYNEEHRIGSTVRELCAFLAGRPFASEIIVVDDGSRDQTSAVVRGVAPADGTLHLVRNETNHGKGFAVRQGVLEARGEIVLYCDADLSTPPTEIERVIAPIRGGSYDLVIGSRRAAQRATQPLLRRVLGAQFRRLRKILVGLPFDDTQCGFKALRRDPARAIFAEQRLDGFTFDVEVLLLARDQGWRTLDLPVAWVDHDGSRVPAFRAGVAMFAELVRLRLGWQRRS